MKVPLIKSELELFKANFAKIKDPIELYTWDCWNQFNLHWNIEDLDFFNVYDLSFKGRLSNRLWVDHDFYPKKIMLQFIKMDKEFVRSMFVDLFDEGKDLAMRIQRFIFHCDNLLEELQTMDRRFNAHYHGDLRMISCYLAFYYPEKYCIYDPLKFSSFMQRVEALRIPKSSDLSKFFILTKSLFVNFIAKDREMMTIFENKMKELGLAPIPNLLLSHALYTR